MITMSVKVLAYGLLLIFCVSAKKYKFPKDSVHDFIIERSDKKPDFTIPGLDLQSMPSAISGFSDYYGSRGRVIIKVYRGPDEGDYASHGYWVRQPADDG